MSWWQSLFKDDGKSVEVREADVVFEDLSSAQPTIVERLKIAEATVSELLAAIRDADLDIAALHAHVQQLEEEWSAKIGEYMQRNAQLRVDAKQALRRATAAEAAVEAKTAQLQQQQQAADAALADAKQAEQAAIDSSTELAQDCKAAQDSAGATRLRTAASRARLRRACRAGGCSTPFKRAAGSTGCSLRPSRPNCRRGPSRCSSRAAPRLRHKGSAL